MKIGIVSDTHGHLANTRKAVEVLGRHELEAVLHCGDIGSPEIVPLFDRWKTHFVFGNVDHDEYSLREAIETAGQTCHGRFGTIELQGLRLALIHSDDYMLFRSTISGQEWDLVCYGHTHLREHHTEGRTLVLNPGAVYRANPHTIALVTLPTLDVEFLELV